MRFHPSRRLLAITAALFAASLLLYSVAWVYTNLPSRQPEAELGFEADYEPARQDQLVKRVVPGSPAETAGMLAGDRVVAIGGMPYTDDGFQERIWRQHKPGDGIVLMVERPGQSSPLHLAGVFRRRAARNVLTVYNQLNLWFPWPFGLVGLAVLFLRLKDPNAWSLAALFGAVAVSRGISLPAPTPAWGTAALAFQGALLGMVGPLFYHFYSRFPTRSPLDRRWPGLKWALAGLGLLCSAGSVRTGQLRLCWPFTRWMSGALSGRITALFVVACMTLGLASFALNFFGARDREARRRMRVMFWGTMLSLVPNVVLLAIQTLASVRWPEWLAPVQLALLLLTPGFFAYAVVVHRVLEFPVLLKRSARYLLVQRGFTILLSLVSVGLTLMFAASLPGYLRHVAEIGQASGIALGAVFGTTLLWSGSQVHKRVSGRIDRAFFRNAYDARVVLEDLAERTRTAADREELARLLESHLDEALKPSFLSVELRPDASVSDKQPEYAVPILSRDGRRLGVLALGPRLSEEPYSREDQRLLASVASQTGAALENFQLAEEIAGRIESERRVAREMEIAREVQTRLLPQGPPRLDTLDCAARCVQARAVGGDYYDFLDLGRGRVGLILADVCGKGVHSALLVTHLQACLRTQCSMTPLEPVAMLSQVNRMLYRSTAPEHFATLFFGIYDDSQRELLYVNCGHNPPIVLRRDGKLTRLEATATVIGAFDWWEGSACSARLDAGDLLVVFSDGVTEAERGEEQFGEQRLVEGLLACEGGCAETVLSDILARVQQFSAGAQSDDVTLLVARAK